MTRTITPAVAVGFGLLTGVGIAFAQDSGEFRELFNGENLEGWHGNNPHTTNKSPEGEREAAVAAQQEEFEAHWSVENGELVNDGHGPYATTDEEFGDVEFHLEYKTVPKADSGIYMRGTPQIQIWDTTEEGGKWDRNADDGSGGLFNNTKGEPGQLPLVHADREFGEWNSFRVIQLGSRTTVHFNDELVVDNAIWENYWDKDRLTPLPATGPIHLQTHGGEIRWRNIRAREIGAEEANALLRGDDAEQGFSSIFDGSSFAGWQGAVEEYEIVDGAIVCQKGKGGNLFTDERYADFVVRLEFKLPPGGNNGLAIRYPGQGNPSGVALCELQVLDNTAEKYANLKPYQFHGSAYSQVPAHVGYLRPVGEWNYQEVTVQGQRVTVELNGTVILDAELERDITEGHFGFAGHNDPVAFRNIAIKRL